MKFLHLGDLHLGKSLGDYDLRDDQEFILKEILGIIKEKNIDGVLIAGDVYDRAIPSESATNLLDYFLNELKSLNVKTFAISGNHDSDDRLNYGSRLFESNSIYISSIYDGTLYKRTVNDDKGDIDIYLLPFVKASQVRHFFPDENIEDYEDAVRVIIEKAGIDKSRRNILVAHQFVTGDGMDPVLGGSEGPAVTSVGTVEKISYRVFDDFDYVALGHIHSNQSVGREQVRYSGSPLKYSLSEVNHTKCAPIIELGAKGEVNIEYVPLKPLRDVRHLKGRLKDLLAADNIQDTDDYIYVTLTDEDIVNDVMGIFQQYYPRTLKVSYDNLHSQELDNVDFSKVADDSSFPDLIKDFYEMMYGCEISEEEMQVILQVAKEAGVKYEAD